VSSAEVYDGFLRIVEKYGVAVVLSVSLMWILRNDVLIPLVEEHRNFVRELGETQKDIGKVLQEQTVILSRLESNKN
jgi:hypothetical protein